MRMCMILQCMENALIVTFQEHNSSSHFNESCTESLCQSSDVHELEHEMDLNDPTFSMFFLYSGNFSNNQWASLHMQRQESDSTKVDFIVQKKNVHLKLKAEINLTNSRTNEVIRNAKSKKRTWEKNTVLSGYKKILLIDTKINSTQLNWNKKILSVYQYCKLIVINFVSTKIYYKNVKNKYFRKSRKPFQSRGNFVSFSMSLFGLAFF